ncbi:hypothetical protein RclHR1_01190007 [Rhizophagus clarus]|uniref:F-box domain-containing protein n=1 Tax=Rhizophagus clarus TaxID=94130 RepID=A0A2Z6QKQ2_9GLOM|nr:hypothetical protein RclHR1_01190007 [Rhizophagus clarus]GET02110.1 hypothetical protein GLOIN_2v1573959 [Rhizophagus clarus]
MFPLSFISNFINLQELQFSFNSNEDFINFGTLQHTSFSQLKILKFQRACPRNELLIKFLENNGKNLKEIYLCEYTGYCDNSINLAIARFCPNIRKLSIGIKNNESETLGIIFINCQYLESIKIWCGGEFLNEKEALETVVKYSQNIYELILYYQSDAQFELLPIDLESFFINWTSCKPHKSLSLVIVNYGTGSLDANDENMEIIKKYIKLGVTKNFKVTDFTDE